MKVLTILTWVLYFLMPHEEKVRSRSFSPPPSPLPWPGPGSPWNIILYVQLKSLDHNLRGSCILWRTRKRLKCLGLQYCRVRTHKTVQCVKGAVSCIHRILQFEWHFILNCSLSQTLLCHIIAYNNTCLIYRSICDNQQNILELIWKKCTVFKACNVSVDWKLQHRGTCTVCIHLSPSGSC